MNRKQAEAMGLTFAGIYERGYHKVKKLISYYTLWYPKAKVVIVKEQGGYSIYADATFRIYQAIEKNQRMLDRNKACVEAIKAGYAWEIKRQAEKHKETMDYVRHLEGVLNKTTKK